MFRRVLLPSLLNKETIEKIFWAINTKSSHHHLTLWLDYKVVSNNIEYRKTSNIRRTLVGNKIVDHSYVVGASPVGAAPTTSSSST